MRVKREGLVEMIAKMTSEKSEKLTAEETGMILRDVEGDEYDEYRKVIAAARLVAKELCLPLDVTSEDFEDRHGSYSWGNIWLDVHEESDLIKKKYDIAMAEILIGTAETPEEFARVFAEFLSRKRALIRF